MIAAVGKYIETHKLCLSSDKVLVAVSGGMDSVVLVHLMMQLGYDITMAHCNFKLRGEASDGDADFVQTLANQYGVNCFVKVCDAKTHADANKCSIQESARDLRYEWFQELLNEQHYDRIATAHHLDDQKETFFINLLRGSGLKGLKGMPIKRGAIIRPLLGTTHSHLKTYALKEGLSWREDASNASDKYLRNRIRHHLMPAFEGVISLEKNNFAKSLKFLAEDDVLFDQLIEEKRKHWIRENKEGFAISLEQVKALNPLAVWLYYLLKPFGFSRKDAGGIAEVVDNKESGKFFHSSLHSLLVDRKTLLIRKRESGLEKTAVYVHRHIENIAQPLKLQFRELTNQKNLDFGKNPKTAYFDLDALKYPLLIRPWKQGDRFQPLGMKGSKLLSDYFIDQKLNQFEKEAIWLLISGHTIIWVIGLRTSENCKVKPSTATVLSISCSG